MKKALVIVLVSVLVLVSVVLVGGGALVVNAIDEAWEDGVDVREVGLGEVLRRHVVEELDLDEWGREPCPDCRERDCRGGYDCDRYDRWD